jgi:TolB-like protein/cytochrome c-type biogenesis protein CcmH/NrfG
LEEKRIATTTARARVSSGYGRLDEVLKGGFLAGTTIVLSAPASDEVPLLVGNFLKASKEQSLLICRTVSSAETITQNMGENVRVLVCSDRPVSPARNIIPGKGIENLTDVNLQIGEVITSAQPKRLVIDILSDILLRHKALQTRKWLTELLERLRSKGITTLAVLNPYMHSSEDVQAVVDLFDGNVEIFEKESEGGTRKYLRIKWMHGIETTEKEFPLEELGPERQETRDKRREPVEADQPVEADLDKRRIAVLPFANLSSNPEDGYFADGMTEELITSLSGVRQLAVIARTSVMKYKGSQKGASDVGKELNAGSLIEGSVRKAANRVRIAAQLIDTSTESHLWAQNYDRNLDDVFAIQSEIAEKVAGELKIRLVDSEKRVITKKTTENTEAYTYFLQGRELLREQTEASLKQAIALFEKAIELDAGFARAYVGQAECHTFLADKGSEPSDVSVATVRRLLERALNLDPNSPEVHSMLSNLLFSEDDVVGSEAEARKALELNPNLPDPYWVLSELAAVKEEPGEMVRQIEAAYRLDPIRPDFINRVGMAYLNTGREQDALEFWKKTEQLAPAFAYRGMTEYYLTKGNLEKAKEFLAKLEKLDPTNPRVTWMGGFIAAMESDRERALLAVRKIEDAKMGPVGFNFISFVYYALGDLDSYFEYLNKAVEAHAIVASAVMYSPLLAKARTDPRHLELVEKLWKQCGLTK